MLVGEVRPQAGHRAVQDPPVTPRAPPRGGAPNVLHCGAKEGVAPLGRKDELLVLSGPGVSTPRRLCGGHELVLKPYDKRRLYKVPADEQILF